MDEAKLIMVTTANNNKYYNMVQVNDDSFHVEYGRIGTTCQEATYPMSKWNAKYHEKINKGYQDVTALHTTVTHQKAPEESYAPLSDSEIEKLLNELQAAAAKTISSNYIIESKDVTLEMVQGAQNIMDDINGLRSVYDINQKLLTLFETIPRRMGNVQDYLLYDISDLPKILKREQELLDVMASQVSQMTVPVIVSNSKKHDCTILEAYGLKMKPASDKDIEVIKKELGTCADKFNRAWVVKNNNTQKAFSEYMKDHPGCRKKLLWHGSRTENWWGILQIGLKIRPANAQINGKMFGYGIYFALKAAKSFGYTSMTGTYWTKGNDNRGFMALYEVAYGKPYKTDTWDSRYATLNDQSFQKLAPDANCLHVKAGELLYNDEIIVYKESQVTIKYLVELKNK